MSDQIRRREFLRQVGASVVAGTVAPTLLQAANQATSTQPAAKTGVGSIRDLPTRRLGKLGIQMPVLSFGTAAMGHPLYEAAPFEEVVNAALEAGIRFFDTSPVYDVAQDRLGAMMGRIRKDIFLVSKTRMVGRDRALRDVENSLKHLKTDYLDLCHLHNVGEFTSEEMIGKGGSLEALLDLKRQGVVRHIGCTGHLRPARFIPIIETGEIEALMVAMNFVDRHTYNFEEQVLPLALDLACDDGAGDGDRPGVIVRGTHLGAADHDAPAARCVDPRQQPPARAEERDRHAPLRAQGHRRCARRDAAEAVNTVEQVDGHAQRRQAAVHPVAIDEERLALTPEVRAFAEHVERVELDFIHGLGLRDRRRGWAHRRRGRRGRGRACRAST